jgi:hypothetical protein
MLLLLQPTSYLFAGSDVHGQRINGFGHESVAQVLQQLVGALCPSEAKQGGCRAFVRAQSGQVRRHLDYNNARHGA